MTDADPNLMLILGRLEGKTDAILTRQGQQDERLNNHGDRIANLEKRQSHNDDNDGRIEVFDSRLRAVEKRLYIWSGGLFVLYAIVTAFAKANGWL